MDGFPRSFNILEGHFERFTNSSLITLQQQLEDKFNLQFLQIKTDLLHLMWSALHTQR